MLDMLCVYEFGDGALAYGISDMLSGAREVRC